MITDVLSGGETLIIETNIDEDETRENTEGKGVVKRKRKSGRGRGRRRGRGRGVGRVLDERSVVEGQGLKGELEMRMVGDAVGGGSKGGGGVAGLLFRKGLRASRIEREVDAVAEARVKAVMGGEYEVVVVDKEEGNGKGLIGKFRGVVGRKWREDDVVDLVELEVLKEVVREMVRDEGTREKLRMREMAKESLVVFWNLVQVYGMEIEKGMMELCPELDWSWLHSRKRKLSAKAIQSRESERLWKKQKQ